MTFTKWRIITIIALLIATLDLPYTYYQALRFLVCGIGLYGIYSYEIQERKYFPWVYGILAILFNPIIPFRFEKETWQLIDVASALVILVTMVFDWKIKRNNQLRRNNLIPKE